MTMDKHSVGVGIIAGVTTGLAVSASLLFADLQSPQFNALCEVNGERVTGAVEKFGDGTIGKDRQVTLVGDVGVKASACKFTLR